MLFVNSKDRRIKTDLRTSENGIQQREDYN